MNTSLVFTFIGPDRTGLVERLSDIVNRHQGNWLESRMVQLAGQFAGIARVELPDNQVDAVQSALSALDKDGLSINIQSGKHAATEKLASLRLAVLGPDRPGIVREVSGALLQRNINVREMSSNVSSAPMSGEPLFEARIDVDYPAGTDLDDLFDQLDEIADKLGVEIDNLGEQG